jgi:regulatory protein
LNLKKKYTDYATALSGMQRYCAYQERSHAEVRSRLLETGVYGETLEQVIGALIEENFLNEERFACAFARGKCHIRKWGRLKIENELKLRKVSSYCIQKAMKEIDHEEYLNNLRSLLLKKAQILGTVEDAFVKNQKLFQYAHQKGYESELITALLKEFFSS